MQRRFSGINRLYGTLGAQAIAAAHIAVVGVGGVGSWIVEALARSGVSQLTLIDEDHVAESNINRQLCALDNTLGRAKVDVLAERVKFINPNCKINCIDQFLLLNNIATLMNNNYSWVIDCIDDFRIKAAMIAYCQHKKMPIITVGAAGGKIDPEKIRISDLYKTEQDALLARTRRLLRQNYHFPKHLTHRFYVPAVWSIEPIKKSLSCDQQDHSLNCSGFGANMPVTATFGMLAASHILKSLAHCE